MQAALAWWNVVSPFGGWGSTLALLFVLVVAAIKAMWEDLKRHQEDRATNASVAHRVMPDGAAFAAPPARNPLAECHALHSCLFYLLNSLLVAACSVVELANPAFSSCLDRIHLWLSAGAQRHMSLPCSS
jgi:hypothetical protein